MSVKQRKLYIRCDEEDYATLAYNARNACMSKSEYMRNLLYRGSAERHTNYTPEDAQRLLSELCKISNAMSHISYNARQKLGVDEGEYLQLESNFKALFGIIGMYIVS